jgi:hypothetical protein
MLGKNNRAYALKPLVRREVAPSIVCKLHKL